MHVALQTAVQLVYRAVCGSPSHGLVICTLGQESTALKFPRLSLTVIAQVTSPFCIFRPYVSDLLKHAAENGDIMEPITG